MNTERADFCIRATAFTKKKHICIANWIAQLVSRMASLSLYTMRIVSRCKFIVPHRFIFKCAVIWKFSMSCSVLRNALFEIAHTYADIIYLFPSAVKLFLIYCKYFNRSIHAIRGAVIMRVNLKEILSNIFLGIHVIVAILNIKCIHWLWMAIVSALSHINANVKVFCKLLQLRYFLNGVDFILFLSD